MADNEVPLLSPSEFSLDMEEEWRNPPDMSDPVMLTGIPGGGKTSVSRQTCERIGLPLWVLRPIQHDTVEYTGLPYVANPSIEKLCGMMGEYLHLLKENGRPKPALAEPPTHGVPMEVQTEAKGEWIPFDKLLPTSKDWEGVIFIDEVTQLDQDSQKVMASIIDREGVAGRRIPLGARFLLAGNREQDRAGAGRMISIIESRCRHVELDFSMADWQNWAAKNGVNESVRAFGQFKGDAEFVEFNSSRKLNPLPRTWHRLSRALDCRPNASFDESNTRLLAVLTGIVGPIAISFMEFSREYHVLHNVVDDILNRPDDVELGDKTSTKYAVIGGITQAVKDRGNLKDGHFTNVVKFATKNLTRPMQGILCVNMLATQIDTRRDRLMGVPAFQEWMNDNAAIIAAWKGGVAAL